jgi:hypothetical protein
MNEKKKKLKLDDFNVFRGVITKSELIEKKTKYSKYYLVHLEIKPLDFEVKGKTGRLHSWYKVDYENDSEDSWDSFMFNLRLCIDTEIHDYDYDKLLNLEMYFIQKEYNYKTYNGESRVKTYYLPYKEGVENV